MSFALTSVKLASVSRLCAPNGGLEAPGNFLLWTLHLEVIFSDINTSSFQSTNILYSYAILNLIRDFMRGAYTTLQNPPFQECYRHINMPQHQELCNELPKDIIRSIGSDSTVKIIEEQKMHSSEIGKFHTINLLPLELFSHEFNHLLRTQQATQP